MKRNMLSGGQISQIYLIDTGHDVMWTFCNGLKDEGSIIAESDTVTTILPRAYTLSLNSHTLRVSSNVSNVLLHPMKGKALVS